MRRTYIGLFLLALTTLIVEVLLTKIFDVLLWPNMSFMIISCAMFGLGLGGLYKSSGPGSVHGVDQAATDDRSLLASAFGSCRSCSTVIPFSVRSGRVASRRCSSCVSLFSISFVLAPFFFGRTLHLSTVLCRRRATFSGCTSGTSAARPSARAIFIPLLRPLGPERGC